MRITFHGGANEIGGNKFLLESNRTRIWLDFGISFKKMSQFYSEFLTPRKYNGLGDFFEMGLLPNYKGIYRTDFVKKTKNEIEATAFDGVIVSHAHMDHAGFIPLIHKDIPIFCGATTKIILEAMQDTGSGFEYEFCLLKEHFTGLARTHIPKFSRNLKTFRTGDEFKIKEFEFEPIHVNHSVPGAYGFIIHGEGKRIVYTGDLREGRFTNDFISKAAEEKVDLLLCEGTRADGKPSLSEEAVYQEINKIVSSTKNLVVANWPPRDIDRFKTFYKAAVENDRLLAISTRMAHLIKLLEKDEHLELPRLKDEHLAIYCKRVGDGLLVEPGVTREKIEKEYEKWQRDYLWLPNSICYKDVAAAQKDYILYLDSFSFGELIDIRPKEGSCYIYSLTAPFSDEMELDVARMRRWIDHFKLSWNEAHASGHMGKENLIKLIDAINPETLIPIHTETPQFYKNYKKIFYPKQGSVFNF